MFEGEGPPEGLRQGHPAVPPCQGTQSCALGVLRLLWVMEGVRGGMRVSPLSPSPPGTAVGAGGCASSASRRPGVGCGSDSHHSGLVGLFFWVIILQTCQEQRQCWDPSSRSPVSFQPVTCLHVERHLASRKEKDFSP